MTVKASVSVHVMLTGDDRYDVVHGETTYEVQELRFTFDDRRVTEWAARRYANGQTTGGRQSRQRSFSDVPKRIRDLAYAELEKVTP